MKKVPNRMQHLIPISNSCVATQAIDTLGYQEVGAQGLRPFRNMAKGLPIKKIPKNFLWRGHTMANATLRYQQALNITKINNIDRFTITFLSICQ